MITVWHHGHVSGNCRISTDLAAINDKASATILVAWDYLCIAIIRRISSQCIYVRRTYSSSGFSVEGGSVASLWCLLLRSRILTLNWSHKNWLEKFDAILFFRLLSNLLPAVTMMGWQLRLLLAYWTITPAITRNNMGLCGRYQQ